MKQFFINKKNITIIGHIIFWILHFILRLNFAGFFYTFDTDRLALELINLSLRICVTYYTIYVIIYKYLLEKKFLKFFVYLAISVSASVLLRRAIQFYIIFPLQLDPDFAEGNFFNVLRLIHSTIYIYPIVGIASIIILVKNWYDEQKLRLQLANEKLEAELKYLKAQLHPHFLFNTINNIYSLALEKSDKTANALLKLSKLLSFMLYESNVPKIQLSKEIQVLNNYIELEKIRYEHKLDFSFNIEGSLEDKYIAPLLLLPIVENCFKHGAGESINQSWIKLDLKIYEDTLFFTAENKNNQVQSTAKFNEGIGLRNIRKRLDLIYRDNNELEIYNKKDSFMVKLKINIETGLSKT